MPRVITGFE